jgi:hypothetical protein
MMTPWPREYISWTLVAVMALALVVVEAFPHGHARWHTNALSTTRNYVVVAPKPITQDSLSASDLEDLDWANWRRQWAFQQQQRRCNVLKFGVCPSGLPARVDLESLVERPKGIVGLGQG